jgi:hypothetical protein
MEVWRRAGAHLTRRGCRVPAPGRGSQAVLEFRSHNELGLTLGQLAGVADAQRAPRVVWEGLRAAAAVMRLDTDDPAYVAAILLIGGHLAGAGNWAVLRRLVSERDPIGGYDTEPRSPPHRPTGDVSGG